VLDSLIEVGSSFQMTRAEKPEGTPTKISNAGKNIQKIVTGRAKTARFGICAAQDDDRRIS